MKTRESLLRKSLEHTVADVHYNPSNSLALEWTFVGTCFEEFDLPEKPDDPDGMIHIYDIECGVWRDLMIDYVELHHTDWYDYVEFDETEINIPADQLANLPENASTLPKQIIKSPAIDVFDWCSRVNKLEYSRFKHAEYFEHIKRVFNSLHKTKNREWEDMLVFHEQDLYEDTIKELNVSIRQFMFHGENTDATTEQLDSRCFHLAHGGEFTIYDEKLR